MSDTAAILSELARVKAAFQLRGIVAAMGLHPDALDDAGRDLPQAFAAPASDRPFFHASLNTQEVQ